MWRFGAILCTTACAGPAEVGMPSLDDVSPPSGLNTEDVRITLTGRNLTPGLVSDVDDGTTQVAALTVLVGDNLLNSPRLLSDGEIEATVPTGLTPGLYDVTVRIGGRDATRGGAYRVLGPNCYQQWLDGTIRFGPAVPISEVNLTFYERDPFLTDDELTLWLSAGGDGSVGSRLLVARRASLADAFSPPEIDMAFDSPWDESKVSITGDGLYAVVGSNRPDGTNLDVWESSRPDVTSSWSTPTRNLVANANTPGSDHDPTISRDGLRLYLAPADPAPQRLAVATRATRADVFDQPVPITELFSNAGDSDPSPTPDERILLFSSERSGNGDLWFATRATVNDPFGVPTQVPDLNTSTDEGDPHLSRDGCRLYFGRQVDPVNYNWDIFVATALLP